MFFFGSISTFLPYLLYISVVWICVLIGFRGQFFPGFLFVNEANDKVVVETKENNKVDNCYILDLQEKKNTISQNKSIYRKKQFGFLKPEIIAQKCPDYSIRVYQTLMISGNSMRAPPILSV